MGMFDEIKCKMPLPVEIGVDHRDHWFQTKCLDCCLEYYEIREDGSLWKQQHAKESIGSAVAWIPFTGFTGEVCFYTQLSEIGRKNRLCGGGKGWIEFSSYFVKGQLKHLELLELKPEASDEASETRGTE